MALDKSLSIYAAPTPLKFWLLKLDLRRLNAFEFFIYGGSNRRIPLNNYISSRPIMTYIYICRKGCGALGIVKMRFIKWFH